MLSNPSESHFLSVKQCLVRMSQKSSMVNGQFGKFTVTPLEKTIEYQQANCFRKLSAKAN